MDIAMQQPMNIVLFEPVIPQNTGAIARLCACTGTKLHLIHPLGFKLDEASVKRAGLDYWPYVSVTEHQNFSDFLEREKPQNLFFFSKFATKSYAKATFPLGSYFVFGSETKGLPKELHEQFSSQFLFLPMYTHIVRSLNLSQSASIVLYEALRQTDALDSIAETAAEKYVEYGNNPLSHNLNP